MIGRVALVGLAVLLGVVAAVGAFFGTASVTDRPALFTLSGLAALALITFGAVALATLGLAPRRKRGVRVLVAGATVVGVVLVSVLTVFRPPDGQNLPPEPVSGQRFWNLPSGSRLAYAKVAAVGTPKPTPIIYLHGGPGVPEMTEGVRYFGRLARDGYDVYDQIGTGRSPRLADPTRHTVARHVADLEAVRERTGAQRVILIGHSWGSTLAAAYMAEHGEHVEKVVFSSPGAMSLGTYGTGGTAGIDRLSPERRERLQALLFQPRVLTAWTLTQINPRAAHAFAGDREMDARFDRIFDLTAPGLFCDPQTVDLPHATGTGFYANQVTLADENAPDPRCARRGCPRSSSREIATICRGRTRPDTATPCRMPHSSTCPAPVTKHVSSRRSRTSPPCAPSCSADHSPSHRTRAARRRGTPG